MSCMIGGALVVICLGQIDSSSKASWVQYSHHVYYIVQQSNVIGLSKFDHKDGMPSSKLYLLGTENAYNCHNLIEKAAVVVVCRIYIYRNK